MLFLKLYLQDVLEVQLGVLKEGTRVLIIDDLLATGGN
jgi:adenine/guanine phosphoribosyltransferase-like PRPP-binding protein